jgi:hypothetical protein
MASDTKEGTLRLAGRIGLTAGIVTPLDRSRIKATPAIRNVYY